MIIKGSLREFVFKWNVLERLGTALIVEFQVEVCKYSSQCRSKNIPQQYKSLAISLLI